MNKSKNIFFPNLDALRFFSFLSVFFYHSFSTQNTDIKEQGVYIFIKDFLFENGILGVNFFFVLSGFLITYLLLAEKQAYKKISVPNFYIRRILRIWPLFYFCVFFGFVIFPFLKGMLGQTPNETASPIAYIFFLNNLDFVANGVPDSSVLAILWSVAIEEQFYLLWPLLVGFTPTKRLPWVFLFIVSGSFVFRYMNAGNYMVTEYHSLSCISDLTIGGAGACFSFFYPGFLNKVKSLKKPGLVLIYLTALIFYLFRKDIFSFNAFTVALDRLVISIVFLLIILEQNFNRHSLFKFENLKTISRLGQYTYGLYCLHMIGILVTVVLLGKTGLNDQLWGLMILEPVISLAITIMLAYLSYQYFEKRFLKLKSKFALVKSGKLETIEEKKPVSGWGTRIWQKLFVFKAAEK